MCALIRELYPLPRSITGNGVRATLDVLARYAPVEQVEVPSGTSVLDWEVPLEWNLRKAYIADSRGRRVVDADRSTLHVVGYSIPISRRMQLEELRPHLHSLPEHPAWIPYRTSYWNEDWGFCLADEVLSRLPDDEYEVVIDSTLEPGSLTYGELELPGETDAEVLISTHVCHPALANDGLSGIAVATFLARALAERPHHLSYRFLFVPGTIGAITWLARNEGRTSRIMSGLVLSCVGDAGPLTYKRSRRGDSLIDRAVAQTLSDRGAEPRMRDFSPYGYDERQYCSPGFDLPVGSLTRTPYGEFDEYHTSADDLDLVQPEALADTLAACLQIIDVLERNGSYRNLNPKGEPQLGRRGLYGTLGGAHDRNTQQFALLWVLNLSDGGHDLLDVTERSGLSFAAIAEAADRLRGARLIEPMEGRSR